MDKALDGISVIEFSSNMAAAYAAMLLAEQGARALRVEPVEGAAGRGTPHFHVLNRGKRAAFIDLESASGRAEVARLIERTDIVIAGFTPSRLRALGLDYEAIRRVNPRAIALYAPPFGLRGPDADLDGDEELAAALGGIPGTQWARSGEPVALTFPAASYSAGVLGAAAVTAALIARSRDGGGQAVEVSLLAGTFSLQTGGIMRHEKMTSLYHGPQDPLGPIPCYRLFEAKDGRYLFVACGNPTFWNKFALALERPELVADPRFEGAPWGIAPQHWQSLKDILEAIMRTRTRAEWLAILRAADVPSAPVLTRQEFIEHPQVRALGMRREVTDPVLGVTVQMGIPVQLGDTPGDIGGPAPALSHDGDGASAWLEDNAAAPSPPLSQAPNTRRGPLSGVVVLDFCSYIAGSYGPMILAQMGAEVIKVESLEGDAFRHFGFGFLGWNQGKRGLSLNLGSDEGRAIIHELAAKADIVVENLRPGRMRRFGLDYATLAAINPRLIYMSVNGFGNRGPEYNQPGFDPLLQARSGVMAAQGGPHGHPVYLTCAICDYGAAMLSAFGCILALHARQSSGRGQFCETSLLQSAMALQAGEFIFYDGRPDMENGGAEYRGSAALNRCYRCGDGQWLFISAHDPNAWNALASMLGDHLPAMSFEIAAREPAEGKLAAALSEHFNGLERASALQAMRAAGIPATTVNRFGDLFDEPQVNANELLIELPHSEWGRVIQSGMLTKFSATPGKIERSAPLLGEHTEEILTSYLGYTEERIAGLIKRRIVQ
ncbi:MAG: CaiB/BaiF CoA transferase family protein [Candidatus Binataceae bacterium]